MGREASTELGSLADRVSHERHGTLRPDRIGEVVVASVRAGPENQVFVRGFRGATADGRAPGAPAVSLSRAIGALHEATGKEKSRWNAGLRMARPGLEPGTPRFSVVRYRRSNGAEIPAKSQI
jgi:hypothetical protein